MKYKKYLLLLLLTASCASQQSVRHRGSHQADVRPVVPAVRQASTSVATEDEASKQETVNVQSSVAQTQGAAPQTWQDRKRQVLDSLCRAPFLETTQLGLYVYDLTDGQPLYASGAAQRMRPASCQKVVTAVTALHYLGGDYQFRTDFRITGSVKSRVLEGDLIVVGGMDPLVTAEELLQAAASIKQQQGIDRISGHIIYDLSMREDKEFGWGWCWDDDYGPLSALLVDGKATFEKNWLQALQKAGIQTKNQSSNAKSQKNASHSVYSILHGIDDLLVPMMKNSDNIYAECLFYQTAASVGKKWAGRKEGAQRTEELLSRIGLNPSPYQVADGSGLSLYNYVSAEMLVEILCHAWRTQAIREHLMPSLPIAGVDGTLEKRMQGTVAQGNVRAKTGTVTGVSSLAGYLTAVNGHTLVFAIINQGISSAAIGRTFQDKVCQELCR